MLAIGLLRASNDCIVIIDDLRRHPTIPPQLRDEPGRLDLQSVIVPDRTSHGNSPSRRARRPARGLDYLASGMTEAEILRDFPDLTSEDIRACLAFAADRERKLASAPPA